MKKILVLLLVLSMSVSAFADGIKVTGKAPTVKGGPGADIINKELADTFTEIINEMNDQFSEINYKNPNNSRAHVRSSAS